VIFGRLVSACPDGKLTPQAVLKLRPARMRKAGLSQQKTDYIRDLARRTAAGEVDFSALPGMNDEGVIECLTRVRGIGVWTAHMFLIFALRRPNVLPTEDLGIRVAIKKAYGLTDLPKPAEVAKLGEAWRPWATVASWYLWRSLESKAGL
jgi:DNA-3-methyladenine glycosylase II